MAAAGTSLRAARQSLVDQVLARTLSPVELPARYAAAADRWLVELLELATAGDLRGLALVAVGGYGAGSLCPGSDLDLLLLHHRRRDHARVAGALWHRIWDEGIKLDHSVRTVREAEEVARDDLKALLGLLDARLVAGSPALLAKLDGAVVSSWRSQLPALLPALEASVAARHAAYGELAFLLEPDLKQSSGGLRDLAVLRTLGRALPGAAELAAAPALADAGVTILAARAALQCRTGTATDRLVLQEQDAIAPLLGLADADVLAGGLAHSARAVLAGCELAWREAHAFARSQRGRRAATPAPQPLPGDLLLVEDEVVPAPGADLDDPALPLRLARAAAEHSSHIPPGLLDELQRRPVELAEPWPPSLRDELVAVLLAGAPAVSQLEALDRHGLLARYLPEWHAVRNRPQRNAYHRFTVDRHLLEAAANAAALAGRVERPDLLVLGALLHDIGKGRPGDHSEVGAAIAERVARRIGLPPADVSVLRRLAAYHLLLPEIATRRDLDDPGTAHLVARLVEDRATLRLLEALTEADGRATGPSAWGPWKAELVRALADRAERVLAGERLPEPRTETPSPGQLAAMAEHRLLVEQSGRAVSVVAPDRRGLLAAAAGVLALNGCNVRRAKAGPGTDGMALDVFHVEPMFDRPPDVERVATQLAAALAGDLSLADALASQDQAYARAPGRRAGVRGSPRVVIDNDASERCSVVEVRAPDRFGLLFRVTDALARAGLDVVAALVDTLGHEVVDAFYVQEPNGGKLTGARRDAVRMAVTAALAAVGRDRREHEHVPS